MKDYHGKVLKIGDIVVYADGYQQLRQCKVLRFGKKMVILEHMVYTNHAKRYPSDLLIINDV